ncbi:MAG: hypothetical protein O3B73_07800 [bacterium]|nr:hypothetical protein [bacterium]
MRAGDALLFTAAVSHGSAERLSGAPGCIAAHRDVSERDFIMCRQKRFSHG